MNEVWAKQLIEELSEQGVRYFCIAPGSRSTPLTVAVNNHPLTETFVHSDERGLGFHALGYAKATGVPAAVIVTSGTAVGNLLPSIMEAHSYHIPMILLTADRPPELRDCGANQTIDQARVFTNFVRWQCDFPCADPHIPQSYIGTTIANAVTHAKNEPAGPVQLNCMFREPFFQEDNTPSTRETKSFLTQISFGEKALSKKDLQSLAAELSKYEKGVIIANGAAPHGSYEPMLTLSKLLKWPIFPDILSPIRSHGATQGVIPAFDLILKSATLNEDFSPDAVLQFGDRFVSKKLFEWIGMKKPKFFGHVAPHHLRMDPLHALTHKIIAEPWSLIENLVPHLSNRESSSWFEYWDHANSVTEKTLVHFFKDNSSLSEPFLFHALSNMMQGNTSLFLGNSLPVREADTFFFPSESMGPIFGNRGVSGIDGNMATCAGIAKGLDKPLLAIIGDLTFLHDLTSLDHLRKSPVPVTVLVINNDGGGLFSFLPIAKKTDVFEPYFATPHGLELKHAADLFKLDYTAVETGEELNKALAKKQTRSQMIEMRVNRSENHKLHQDIVKHLKDVINHSSVMHLA